MDAELIVIYKDGKIRPHRMRLFDDDDCIMFLGFRKPEDQEESFEVHGRWYFGPWQ